MRIRVAICDENDLTLRGTTEVFAESTAFEVVCSSARADRQWHRIAGDADLAIVDPFHRRRWILDAEEFRHYDSKILIHTDYFHPRSFLKLLGIGIHGFVMKSQTAGPRLLSVAQSVISDAILAIDGVVSEYVLSTENRIIAFAPLTNSVHLTKSESAILSDMLAGLTDREIADSKSIALSTVETHVSNICRKVGASNRFDCAIKVVLYGLVSLNDHLAEGCPDSFSIVRSMAEQPADRALRSSVRRDAW